MAGHHALLSHDPTHDPITDLNPILRESGMDLPVAGGPVRRIERCLDLLGQLDPTLLGR